MTTGPKKVCRYKIRIGKEMEELNSLSFERLQCVSDFCNLAVLLEKNLVSARSAMSKARTLRGVVLSNVFNIDIQTLEATTRIDCDGDRFVLLDHSQSKQSGVEKKEEIRHRKASKSTQQSETTESKVKTDGFQVFRPFGILEPLPAKEARKYAHDALQVVCELASIQRRIMKIDARIMVIKEQLRHHDQICRRIQRILEVRL
ncbi:hypothetical protein RB195_006782 [Necator americanus]